MTADQLRKSILQQAIQGKLVPQDPKDEPASALLERIREEKARLVKEKKIKKEKNPSVIFRGEDNSHYEKFILTGEVKCIDDEIPFELPNGWEWCRLGEVFLHASGKQQSSANNLSGTPQKYITTSNVYWGLFDLKSLKVMNFTDFEIQSKSATKGDLLVCEGGAGYGRSAIWNEDYDICLQNHLHRLRPCIKGICEYVFYLLYLLKESNQLASVGTAMPGLSASSLKNILLPLPPLVEQQRIVAKIEELMPLVEQYHKAQSELEVLNTNIREQLKKSILQYAIEGKLVPQCEEDGTAEDLLQEIQAEKQRLCAEGKLKKKDLTHSTIFRGEDNKYYEKTILTGEVKCIDEEIPFEIPISWRWVRFGQIVRISIGKTPVRGDVRYWSNTTKPWVSISDMVDYGYINNTKEKISDAAASLMSSISPAGSLLMSFKLTVGRTSILNIDAYHNEAIITIYPFIDDEFALRNYLFYTLPILSNMGDSKDAIKGKTLNTQSINNLLIPLPSLKKQLHIINRLEKLYACL